MRNRHIKLLICIAVVLVGGTLSGYIFFANQSTLPAQAADAVLRPLLGSQKTLFLESLYFNGLDLIKNVTYHVMLHTDSVSTPIIQTAVMKTPEENIDHMSLYPLVIDKSLPPIAHEGIWQPIAENLFPLQEVIAQTFIRPDSQRPYAIVSMVKMDMNKMNIGLQAGTYYPGGERHVYGPGVIPPDIQKANILIAAFNGGFQAKDGEYGMVVGEKVYVPLRTNLPVLLLYASKSAQLVMYKGQKLPKGIIAIRQNGPYLVQNGKLGTFTESGIDTWGRTITNSTYTWRSGLGITKSGNIIYAVGNSLVPQTLAKALLTAGAVNAIQLDINPPWVRFIFYKSLGNGQYGYTPLLSTMQNDGYPYLHGYNKDFFYVYKK